MFVAQSSRTMANAKPKFRLPDSDVRVVNMDELRNRRRAEREAEAVQQREAAIAIQKEAVKAYRRRMGEGGHYRINYREIERRICKALKVTPSEIASERRHRHIVLARQAIAYWAARLTVRSLPEIGRLMGGFDHTTILHGKRAYPAKRAAMGRTLRPVQ